MKLRLAQASQLSWSWGLASLGNNDKIVATKVVASRFLNDNRQQLPHLCQFGRLDILRIILKLNTSKLQELSSIEFHI